MGKDVVVNPSLALVAIRNRQGHLRWDNGKRRDILNGIEDYALKAMIKRRVRHMVSQIGLSYIGSPKS